jgi:peptide/nickel transport system permease protein
MYQQAAAPEFIPTQVVARKRSTWLAILAGTGRILTSNYKAAIGALILLGFIILAIFAPMIAPYAPDNNNFLPSAPPSHAHLLGTTSYGQDILSQLIYGTRESLLLALIAGFVATVLSVIIGISAAYLGGLWDHGLSLVTDVFLVVPQLPLMIVIATYAKGGGFWVLVSVIAITGWSWGARQLRPQALSLRNRDFLESARVRGERSAYIILFEVLPTMTSLIVATFLGAAIYAVLAAAGLQFIGLGKAEDLSWGTMLYWGENNEAMMTGSALWILAPGACIALLGAAFTLLNYAFDEIGNPALRAGRRKRGRNSAAA